MMQDTLSRVKALYCNQGLHYVALMLAGTDARAIEYLEQAPILALVATNGCPLGSYSNRARVCQWFGTAVHGGKKLKHVMAAYKLPYPLRKIAGRALAPKQFEAVLRLAKLDPSTLSQIIPAKSASQHHWLNALRDWNERVCRYQKLEAHRLFPWAARAFSGIKQADIRLASDVADFAGAGPAFNPVWTLQQALSAQERWHALLAREAGEKTFFENFHLGFDEAIDYSPFPTSASVGACEFVALNSGQAIFQEGAAMHHCVATYSKAVVYGQARIFSMRKDGKRVATVEYAFQKGRYRTVQVKGPCNAPCTKDVYLAADTFVDSIATTHHQTQAPLQTAA